MSTMPGFGSATVDGELGSCRAAISTVGACPPPNQYAAAAKPAKEVSAKVNAHAARDGRPWDARTTAIPANLRVCAAEFQNWLTMLLLIAAAGSFQQAAFVRG